jgi:hypothetical protein
MTYHRTLHPRRSLRRLSAGLAGLAAILASAACSKGPVATNHSAGPAVATKLTVRSTLDSLSALPQRIHWQAFPSGPASDVYEVDFLIDGRLGWVEHHAPYFFGNDGNWLVTSFLTPGTHTFIVKVITIHGHTATDTVTASVTSPPRPPTPLAGLWTRIVTAADVRKATSDQPPLPGRWQLQIAPIGWQLQDPADGGLLFNVGYGPVGTLQMRPAIDFPPYAQDNQGGFCDDTDPLWSWTYSIADGGRTLTMQPVSRDPCGDRVAILAGTWTRVGN